MADRRGFLKQAAKAAAFAALNGRAARAAQMAQKAPATAEAAFRQPFFWGAATSAVQIEGSPLRAGGGASIWDADPQLKKPSQDGSTLAVADDSYHRWRDDVNIIHEIGINAYRTSISWPRVLPLGTGRVNQAGMDYYDRLIDALLAEHVQPVITVFHFDYPETLQKRGGWLNADSPKWYADYATLVSGRFSDRVKTWLTINEPNIFWALGNEGAMMPPNLKLSPVELVMGSNNILLAHGKGVQALRAAAKQPIEVGIPVAGMLKNPAGVRSVDIDAARKASFAVAKANLGPGAPPIAMTSNVWWLDPIYLGKYNEQGLQFWGPAAKGLKTEDLATIHQPLDFCAVNLYFANQVKAGEDGEPVDVAYPAKQPKSNYGRPITPEVLYWSPKFLHERYSLPIMVTENGLSWDDVPFPDGSVKDPERGQFLDSYLKQLRRVSYDGVPVRGYFYWSLLDNWEFGHGQRFGLVYVDYKTGKRTLKDSAMHYKEIIRTHGASIPL